MLNRIGFINREEEIEVLEEAYRNRPAFMVIYGRRRVGKTRLIEEFLKKHRGIYYLTRLTDHKDNLSRLCMIIDAFYPGFCRGKQYSSLDALLSDLVGYGANIVVIDEFTYWVRVAPRVLPELQNFIDRVLPKSNLLLILSGSLIGIIERDVLGAGSPLYGRRTYNVKLEPLKPWHVKEFLRQMNTVERVMAYAMIGGIPYYLQLFSLYTDLGTALKKTVFNKHGVLYNEPDFLLHEEFRNPSVYSRILKAISNGYNRLGKISEYTGIPKTHLPTYLERLERIGFIKHIKPLWSKKGYYVVKDYFLSFYYSVVEKVRELIELELIDEAFETAKKYIIDYMGRAFEQVLYDLIPLLYKKKIIPKPVIAGKYVHRDIDVDLIIIDDTSKEACLIEAKWSTIDDNYAREILIGLRKKAERIKQLKEYSVKYLIFARENKAVKHRDKIIDIYSLDL